MKGTPKKGKTDIDISAAITSANRLTEKTARQSTATRPENEDKKFINLRLNESDFKQIARLAIEAGITPTTFCKQAAIYMAEMVEAGAFTIKGGNIIDRRKL